MTAQNFNPKPYSYGEAESHLLRVETVCSFDSRFMLQLIQRIHSTPAQHHCCYKRYHPYLQHTPLGTLPQTWSSRDREARIALVAAKGLCSVWTMAT